MILIVLVAEIHSLGIPTLRILYVDLAENSYIAAAMCCQVGKSFKSPTKNVD